MHKSFFCIAKFLEKSRVKIGNARDTSRALHIIINCNVYFWWS